MFKFQKCFVVFVLVCTSHANCWAQTPEESLDAAWVAACAGATPNSAFASQCESILDAGPGSGDRRSEAAVGNNLDTFSALVGNTNLSEENIEDQIEAASDYGPWNLMFGIRFASTNRDTTETENGFETDTIGINGGFSYRASPNVVLSAILDLSRDDSDFLENAGSLDNDGWGLTGILDWNNQANMYASIYLGVGEMDIDSVRNISYTLVTQAGTPEETLVTVDTTATGSTVRDHFSGGGVVGWLHDGDSFNIDLSAGFHLIESDTDGYTEQGGDGLAQVVSEQSQDSSVIRLTAGLQRAVSMNWGVFLPHLRLSYLHEMDQDSRLLSSTFVDDTGQFPIEYETDDPDRDYFDLGVGISAVFSGGNAVFLEYRSLFGHDFLEDDVIALGARIQL